MCHRCTGIRHKIICSDRAARAVIVLYLHMVMAKQPHCYAWRVSRCGHNSMFCTGPAERSGSTGAQRYAARAKGSRCSDDGYRRLIDRDRNGIRITHAEVQVNNIAVAGIIIPVPFDLNGCCTLARNDRSE